MADATKAVHAARGADGHPGLPGKPVVADDERFALGILPGTLRFSFGLEDRSDLLRDLAAPSPSYVSRGADR